MVDFWAEWCGPCRTLGPMIEKAVESRDGDVVLAKVDVDSNQGLAQRYGIRGIPAVKAFRDGEVVDEFTGAIPQPQVERFIDKVVPSEADALVAEGDEQSLRRALELEPGNAAAAARAGADTARSEARRRRRSTSWTASRATSPPRASPPGPDCCSPEPASAIRNSAPA